MKWLCAERKWVFLVHVLQRHVLDHFIVVSARRGLIVDSAERFGVKLSVDDLASCCSDVSKELIVHDIRGMSTQKEGVNQEMRN